MFINSNGNNRVGVSAVAHYTGWIFPK